MVYVHIYFSDRLASITRPFNATKISKRKIADWEKRSRENSMKNRYSKEKIDIDRNYIDFKVEGSCTYMYLMYVFHKRFIMTSQQTEAE